MKTTLRILLLALLALATTLILSCGPPPVSINDRINMFVTSLNGNRSDTYTNCDPNASTDYNAAARISTFWSSPFPPEEALQRQQPQRLQLGGRHVDITEVAFRAYGRSRWSNDP